MNHRLSLALLAATVMALLAALTSVAPAPAAPARGNQESVDAGDLHRVDVVDLNVERKSAAITTALRRAKYVGARLITLQEVCWWQARDLRRAHPHWSVAWQNDGTTPRCQTDRGLDSLADLERMGTGNVAIWTGGEHAKVTKHRFKAQHAGFTQGFTCLHWRTEAKVHLCSAHLLNAAMAKRREPIQFRQARELRRITSRWIDDGGLVVVGGDFNANKSSRTLDQMYMVNGIGRFQEATACQPGVLLCRRQLSTTFDKGKTKIDYIFFSANRMPPGAPHLLRVRGTASDHHMLSGWAYVRLTN